MISAGLPWEAMVEAASRARANAYAPYSRFQVGAAVLGGSGRIHGGCNVENASYGATICAERAALCRAIAEGETTIRALAVVAPTVDPCPPCGLCRQVLAEFGADIVVLMATPDGRQRTATVGELLPYPFGPSHL